VCAHRRVQCAGSEGCRVADVANVDAPVVIVAHSNEDVYLDRYAQLDMGFTDRSDAWPAPYRDIGAGLASLLMLLTAVDAGFGACFFGIPVERIGAYRVAFGVPPRVSPIGAISVGCSDELPRDLSSWRRPEAKTVFRGPVEPAGKLRARDSIGGLAPRLGGP